jgi:hypothetical protein
MQESCDHLLARPALSANEYGQIVVEEAINLAVDLSHGCCAAEDDSLAGQFRRIDPVALGQIC